MSATTKTVTKKTPKKRATKKAKEAPKNDDVEVEVIKIDEPAWKQFIPDKYIDISNDWYSKNGIDPNQLTASEKRELKKREDIEESDLVILLAGFKEAAHKAGLGSVSYTVYSVNEDAANVGCTIELLDDGSTNYGVFTGLACATKENTNYPFNNFLISMAENRAFIRAVRMALNINILGKEEVTERPVANKGNALLSGDDECMSPQESLSILTEKKGKTFADLKQSLQKRKTKYPDCESWKEFQDIPSTECFEIISEMVG